MLRIAIVDDEKNFLYKFQSLLENKYNDLIDSIDLYNNPREFISSKKYFDIVFLDIDMPEIDGIELAKKYTDNSKLIAFVTSKEALVFEAYNQTNSFGFIRKGKIDSDTADIFKRLNILSQLENKYIIANKNRYVEIKCSDIIYIEKLRNNIVIHTEDETITEKKTITDVQKELEKFGFIKTHASYLVNFEYIFSLTNTDVVLSNKEKIPLSRNRTKIVRQYIAKRAGELYE
ncbi:MAG: LytR/AlgR family response regulator transcription factor [Ruminococcus sp.]